MLTDFILVVAATAGATILWRTVVDDYPAFKRLVCRLPLFGHSLVCGVCTSFWFAFIAQVAANPLASWHLPGSGLLIDAEVFVIQWLTLGISTLFVRSAVLSTLDLAAILKHKHLKTHEYTPGNPLG